MTRFILLILVATAAGLAAFILTRQMASEPSPGDELAWVTREFRLTPEQAERIEALHLAYQPVCARHCASIFSIRTRLAELERDGLTDGTAYRDAQQEMAELVGVCSLATRAHLHEVAAVMSPNEARRYLTLVEPQVSRHEHLAPFGLK